jgi:choloylglycine hydrolase
MKHLIIFFLMAFRIAEACTAFQLKAEDGTLIYCRSMEFGFKLNSEMLIVPQGIDYIGTASGGKPGLKWKTKYGFVGLNQSMAKTLVSDGMNEKGLIVGALYFPGFAQYEAFDPAKTDRTLGCWELPAFLLSTCATVQDVKESLSTILVADQPVPSMGDFVLPLHFYVSDNTGAVIAVEYIKGQRKVDENPVGVLTNSPSFKWHLLNLSNFINLSPINAQPVQLSEWTVSNFGQGSGLLGLPGDYTPPSRFVRAVLFSAWAKAPKNSLEAVNLGFHLLNAFDIPKGLVQSHEKNQSVESTEWVVVHDRTSLKTYFRSYSGLRIQMVDFKKIDFARGGFKSIALPQEFSAEDVTGSMK